MFFIFYFVDLSYLFWQHFFTFIFEKYYSFVNHFEDDGDENITKIET